MDGDARFGDDVRKILGPELPTKHVRSGREAAELIARRPWAGIVCDVILADVCGLILAQLARDRDPDVPILVCASPVDPGLANRAQLLHAQLAFKPHVAGNVAAFGAQVRRHHVDRSEKLREIVDTLGDKWRLSPQERRIVELASYGVTRDGMCSELHVTRNTVKTVVGRILRKADCTDLHEVVRAALDRAAFG